MNDYSPSVSHYLLSALLFVAGTAAGYWSFPLLIALYALGVASAAFISIKGAWDARTNYFYSIASLAKEMPSLTQEQQHALDLRVPELRLLFGSTSTDAALMVENSEVDYKFFVEFMENSNASQTWAKRDIEGNGNESRDIRRGKWDKLTAWLMSRRYLSAAPAGRDTYQWRSGAYLQLWNSYVLPYADLVGRKPVLLAQERTSLYQAETEGIG